MADGTTHRNAECYFLARVDHAAARDALHRRSQAEPEHAGHHRIEI